MKVTETVAAVTNSDNMFINMVKGWLNNLLYPYAEWIAIGVVVLALGYAFVKYRKQLIAALIEYFNTKFEPDNITDENIEDFVQGFLKVAREKVASKPATSTISKIMKAVLLSATLDKILVAFIRKVIIPKL